MRNLETSDLERIKLPRRFWDSNFNSIVGNPQSKDNIKKKIAGYLSQIKKMRELGGGLVLWGPNGSGKTSIGAVIIKQARRNGFTALFLSCANIKSIVVNKEMYDSEDGTTLWARAKKVDFLLLDDLGKGSLDSQGFGERLIDELIRERYSQNRCTIITTNVNKQNLSEFIKPSTLHILKGSSMQLKISDHDFRISEGIEIRDIINGGDQ